jgi:hypothetical protein
MTAKVSIAQPQGPGERINYTIDFSERLDEGDTLAAIDALAVFPATTPPLVVSGGLEQGALAVRLWAQGGTAKTAYQVALRVATAATEVLDVVVTLKVA